jgi:hypothetical protein
MVSNPDVTNGPVAQGDAIGPGLFGSLSGATGIKRGHLILIAVAAFVVVVVALGVGIGVFTSMSRQTQSYKDGFSAGGAVYAADASAQLGAQQACKVTELRGPDHGGLPSGANAAQWIDGCVAAFNSAQGGN